jgi:hypothetical protein
MATGSDRGTASRTRTRFHGVKVKHVDGMALAAASAIMVLAPCICQRHAPQVVADRDAIAVPTRDAQDAAVVQQIILAQHAVLPQGSSGLYSLQEEGARDG